MAMGGKFKKNQQEKYMHSKKYSTLFNMQPMLKGHTAKVKY